MLGQISEQVHIVVELWVRFQIFFFRSPIILRILREMLRLVIVLRLAIAVGDVLSRLIFDLGKTSFIEKFTEFGASLRIIVRS